MRGFSIVFGWGLLLLLPVPVEAEPQVERLRVEIRHQRALLSFHLTDALDERFYERLESGLPTAFVFEMELDAQRRLWFDKTFKTNELQVIAMYDALEREYLVNYKLGGKLVESRVIRDLAELGRAMTRLEDVPAFDLTGVSPKQRLQIRLRAVLGTKTVLSVIPSTITTDWVESSRFNAPGSGP